MRKLNRVHFWPGIMWGDGFGDCTARGSSLIGVSPSFDMPAQPQLNVYTCMAVN